MKGLGDLEFLSALKGLRDGDEVAGRTNGRVGTLGVAMLTNRQHTDRSMGNSRRFGADTLECTPLWPNGWPGAC